MITYWWWKNEEKRFSFSFRQTFSKNCSKSIDLEKFSNFCTFLLYFGNLFHSSINVGKKLEENITYKTKLLRSAHLYDISGWCCFFVFGCCITKCIFWVFGVALVKVGLSRGLYLEFWFFIRFSSQELSYYCSKLGNEVSKIYLSLTKANFSFILLLSLSFWSYFSLDFLDFFQSILK